MRPRGVGRKGDLGRGGWEIRRYAGRRGEAKAGETGLGNEAKQGDEMRRVTWVRRWNEEAWREGEARPGVAVARGGRGKGRAVQDRKSFVAERQSQEEMNLGRSCFVSAISEQLGDKTTAQRCLKEPKANEIETYRVSWTDVKNNLLRSRKTDEEQEEMI